MVRTRFAKAAKPMQEFIQRGCGTTGSPFSTIASFDDAQESPAIEGMPAAVVLFADWSRLALVDMLCKFKILPSYIRQADHTAG